MHETNGKTPWAHLDESGAALSVDVFITTLMSQVGNALRRKITIPYADQFELTVSEWRLLALIAHAGRVAFSELVVQSTSDKALVSRTLKLLEKRELVVLDAQGNTPRKKLYCEITQKGQALHAQVMPLAQAAQARALRQLSVAERDALFRALMLLREYGLREDDESI